MSQIDTINFTRGVPDPATFPLEQIIDCTAKVIREKGTVVLQYGPAVGYGPLREWIGAWQGVDASQVLTGNGSLEIMEFVARALLRPGDVVFVESPTYDRVITTLRKQGVKVIGIPLEANGPMMDVLEVELKKQIPKFFYLIPDFQNPSGATCSGEKRRRIVELADKYNFLLIEDGPYRYLRYQGRDEPSLLNLSPERVLHLSSFTKLLAPGVRLGFMIAPPTVVSRVSKVAEDAYITPGYFAHGVTLEWCARGYLPAQIEKLKSLYGPRLETCLAAIRRFLPETEATSPEGGFFVSLTLPVSITALREEAAKLQLNLSDGMGFFPNGGGERFVRLPFCGIPPEQVEEGVRRLAQAVETLKSK